MNEEIEKLKNEPVYNVCPHCEVDYPEDQGYYDDTLGDQHEYCSEECHQAAYESQCDDAHDSAKEGDIP